MQEARGQFGTAVIVGVGLIGGSLGLALRQQGLAQQVIGVEPDAARGQAAVGAGAVDAAVTDWREAIADADLVVLCGPVRVISESVAHILAHAKAGAVVTDAGSTKGEIVKAAGTAFCFVGGHPMAGSERGGVEAARADLFRGATWAITPAAHTDAQAVDVVERLAQSVGAVPLRLSPPAHDAMVATTSHLPHALAAALMCEAAALRVSLPAAALMSAGSFAGATRVALSAPQLWRDVCLSNREALQVALAQFRGQLEVLEAALAAEDAAAVEEFFAAGRVAKEEWGR